jgi:poly-gamma-glutamate synthesis protein (capsule biosynthesis protein)
MINVLVAGDFYPNDRVAKLVEDEKYNEIFNEISKYTSKSDISIVNFECPVISVDNAIKINKHGPNLKCSPKAVLALKSVGFNVFTLSNNHIYDYGEIGLANTFETCKLFDIETVGCGMNLTLAQKIYYKKINNKLLAIINISEHEFSIATNKRGGANPLDPVANYYHILEAKNNADFLILIVHGGHEHFNLPSLRMIETYRFFVDIGADVVINHHQHCLSGYEIYKGKPFFYGTGNFSFDKRGARNSNWNEGYLVNLILSEEHIKYKLIPYIQGDENPGIVLLKERVEFDKKIQELNRIISDYNLLKQKVQDYYLTNGHKIFNLFEPYSNKYLVALRNRSLLPAFINKKKRLLIQNIIDCESHRDKIIGYLKTQEN